MRSQWLRRDAVLREMGLTPLWRLRERGAAATVEETVAPSGMADSAGGQSSVQAGGAVDRSAMTVAATAAGASGHDARPVPAGSLVTELISETDPGTGQALSLSSSAGTEIERARRIAALDWDALEAEIRACQACGLCRQRKQAVPGVGDRQAQWMFVGEGPGAEEDQRGEPFVGQAGRLLDNMFSAIGLTRQENVYIANTVKCRPPHNRTPEVAEMAACRPYLERQIALVKPRLLIALGRPAAQALTGTEVRIGAARGRLFRYGEIPLIVTYHPAYLLRNPQDKAKAWEDLCFTRRTIAAL